MILESVRIRKTTEHGCIFISKAIEVRETQLTDLTSEAETSQMLWEKKKKKKKNLNAKQLNEIKCTFAVQQLKK